MWWRPGWRRVRCGERDGQWGLLTDIETLQAGAPESLRQMIEQQLDRLTSEEQRVVEAGSVAGIEFSAAAVAASVDREIVQVEACCASLTRRGQLLRASGEQVWPDGTVAGCYSFIHALYQEVVYQRVPAAQRVYLHRRIGERAEAGYGTQASDIAAELAMHFERGRNYHRAVAYLQHAADTAVRRYANAEAAHHLSKGLALLKALPAHGRAHAARAHAAMCPWGVADGRKGLCGPGSGACLRAGARAVSAGRGYPAALLRAVGPIAVSYRAGRNTDGAGVGGAAHQFSAEHPRPGPPHGCPQWTGTALPYRGELRAARAHLEQSIALYDPHKHHARAFFYGTNLKADSLAHLAHVLWLLGIPSRPCRTTAHSTCSRATSSRPTRSSNMSPRPRCDEAKSTSEGGHILYL